MAIAIGDVNYSNLFHRISGVFDHDEDSIRIRQFNALLTGFFEAPLMGSGLGGFVDDGRVKEKPWSYELFYMASLYKGGVIGFSLIFALMFWIFIKAGFNCKSLLRYRSEGLAILTGISTFCLASFTNPYFSGFDALLILALLPVLASIRVENTDDLVKYSDFSENPSGRAA